MTRDRGNKDETLFDVDESGHYVVFTVGGQVREGSLVSLQIL